MEKKYYSLEQLMMCYFNQDYDIYGHSTMEILNSYIEVDDQEDFKALINDIDLFLKQDDKTLEEEFINNYGREFDPCVWHTTIKAFLITIREQISIHLK